MLDGMFRKARHRNRLKVLRAECQISQIELAFKIDMSRDRYIRIENGYAQPTDRELRKIARVLGVTVDDLGMSVRGTPPASDLSPTGTAS